MSTSFPQAEPTTDYHPHQSGAEVLHEAGSSTLLRIATAGSVDDGKSTLIGRLLYDSKSLMADQLEQVEAASRRRHGDSGEVDLALLTDGLRAEREQGITIDVAYRYFATPKRSFIVADTPGHVRYTRNMVTGASTADLAIVLVDARHGVVEQSRRHACVAALLGIRQVVLAVNKMDLVDFDETVFASIEHEFARFARELGVADVVAIPLSARDGDNVVERSERTPWYAGPPLLAHLEAVRVDAHDATLADATAGRLPVQWVIRPGGGAAVDDELHDYRGYAGQVARGRFRVGDEVAVLPSGARTRIAKIDTFDGPLAVAAQGQSVTVLLEDDIDIARGDVIAAVEQLPTVARDIEAVVCWMHETPLVEGARYLLKHTTRTVRAVALEVTTRLDVTSLERDADASSLELNEIGQVRLRTSEPISFDPYATSRAMGGLILIDEASGDTVAAGMLVELQRPEARHSPNVVREASALTRGERETLLGKRGATVWLTGLPASGKSTVAAQLVQRLVEAGIPAYRLDGDNLRHGLNGDLGFSPEDRAENVRRTAHAAALLADAGVVAIVSLVSPYAADRRQARETHEAANLPFFEVFVDTPLEECERRDPKGLYARARAGEISGMTGIDDPYERPSAAELVLEGSTVAVGAQQALAMLREAGVLTRDA